MHESTESKKSPGCWEEAGVSDDEALVGMCRELNREDPGPDPVPDENMRRTLSRLRGEPARGRALVLRVRGQFGGYALLISFWSNELGGEVRVIDELYVRPEFRGLGYATSLIRSLSEDRGSEPDRAVGLALEVRLENERARDLYARLGFKPTSTQQLRLLFSRR